MRIDFTVIRINLAKAFSFAYKMTFIEVFCSNISYSHACTFSNEPCHEKTCIFAFISENKEADQLCGT